MQAYPVVSFRGAVLGTRYVIVHWFRWSKWFWRVQAVGRYALDHFIPVILVGTLAERHAPADPFGGIRYID